MAQLGRGLDQIMQRLDAEMEAMQARYASMTPDEAERIRQELAEML
jgi:hypothetical protein